MAHDSAYSGLEEADDTDLRWAFGTGFEDPLAGIDATVPDGIDAAALAAYCLMLGDDALILSHRLQQWITRLPELEVEVAVANIALDLLGQARLLLARAGSAESAGRDEDTLAFLRSTGEMRNVHLVEVEDADFADLIVRLLLFSAWRLELLGELRRSADPVLAAIGAKGGTEVSYHRDFAAQWTVRLGDGTSESHQRSQRSLDRLWPLVGELFDDHPVIRRLPGVAVPPADLRPGFDDVVGRVLAAATLDPPPLTTGPPTTGPPTTGPPTTGPPTAGPPTTGPPTTGPPAAGPAASGRDGLHTQAFPALLDELQSVARALPGATW